MIAKLIREDYLPAGTLGRLYWPGIDDPILTVERPWLDNAVGESCIPEGLYECRPRRYSKGGYEAVEICDVPGRTHILFHRGNWPSEVRGCILVGLEPQADGWRRGVKNSRGAWDLLAGAGFLDGPFLLEIAQWRPAP